MQVYRVKQHVSLYLNLFNDAYFLNDKDSKEVAFAYSLVLLHYFPLWTEENNGKTCQFAFFQAKNPTQDLPDTNQEC
jgi:hypothetical protein